MNDIYTTNCMIDEYIENLAISGIITSFYPDAICKSLNLPLTPIIQRLTRLVEDEILVLKYEIRCHEGSHIIAIVTEYIEYLDKEEDCMFCGENVLIDLSNIVPVYYFKNEYKEHLKKKKMLNQLNLISTLQQKSVAIV